LKEVLRQFRDFFVSLRLTVVLLALGIVLIFWATLAQTDIGVWGVQQKFFFCFFVLERIPGTSLPVPVFPGGYFIGGMLFVNLVAAQIYRLKLTWRKLGIWLTHIGIILLLVGELFSSLWQREYQMSLNTGETKDYAESFRRNELAIIDTSDPKSDEVVAIPDSRLARGDPIQIPQLPFRVVPKDYYPNAALQLRRDVPDAPPPLADRGAFAQQIVATPIPLTYKEDERNQPAADVELVGPDGPLGTWFVSSALPMPQHFTYDGRSWKIVMRVTRRYLPYSVTLIKVTNDVYPGTDIPKNFVSRIRLRSDDGRDDREVTIYMNHPLRYRGLTFYQYQMNKASGLSVFQVVGNPSWRIPYIACALVALGLLIQFGLHLVGFAGRRRRAAAVPSSP
jgi:ResB-like family